MNTQSTLVTVEIPDFGNVPVQVNHGREPDSPVDVTHRPPTGSDDPRLRFMNPRIVQVYDVPSSIPQFAVQKQKVISVDQFQLNRLRTNELLVGTSDVQGNLRQAKARVIEGDRQDLDANDTGQYTVLIDWSEDETLRDFHNVLLIDSKTNATESVLQSDNFLISGSLDGPNNPPIYPPVGSVSPLNTQPSDYRPASKEDIQYYQQHSKQDNSPAVAVMDTGLKFNLLNKGLEDKWPDPYMYQDANGQERRFTLAYHKPKNGASTNLVGDSVIGYCALQSYREEPFFKAVKESLLSTDNSKQNYTLTDVANSPFDDYRLLENPPHTTTVLDARHGTSITAIIQQTGDDAPVLPVKVFDNIGFSTLFDVLNGFDYILKRCKTTNIRVVNASWIFGQDNPLIRSKVEQLLKAGVFIVAAAGNEGQTSDRNLDNRPVYPACYSQEFPHVITVTSVRKTYFRSDLLSPKEDSVVGKALAKAVKAGLFNFLEGADDVVGAILPTAGYVAVENYSTKFVNIGVVSTFGYFRSPFRGSPIIRGSSFACAFVTGSVIRQLRNRPELMSLLLAGSISEVRMELLKAMNGNGPDKNLMNEYVNGGFYLDGYGVD
ncbi:S8 family serine peptidase [Spirosoma soli]|uniref:S8 family serine peptidase n=1 Tax=Spirosoma soli TaxID=1770529 RepID=A0ABW5LXQ5_9BACT